MTSPKAIRPRTVLGTEFRFVRCERENLFGLTELWVTKTERVVVSDLERTIVDGLKAFRAVRRSLRDAGLVQR